MENIVEKRIKELQRVIKILEDHLNQFRDNINSKHANFIQEKLELYKREIKIRKDFPISLVGNYQ